MNNELMFSSKTDLWSTPNDFFDKLNDEFHFTLDPCSTHENAKCYKHFTEDRLKTGLKKPMRNHKKIIQLL